MGHPRSLIEYALYDAQGRCDGAQRRQRES